MALTKAQTTLIDTMIGDNKKGLDIVQELVGNQKADVREVNDYLKENKTLQGIVKTITHRSKEIIAAGDEATRTAKAKEVEKLSKKVIKILQNKAKE